MQSKLELAYLPEEPDWIPVESDKSVLDALAQRGLSSSPQNYSGKFTEKV